VSFPFNVYGLALVSSGLTTALAFPLARRLCLRSGLVDDPGGRKIHDQPIPLAGGLAVLAGLCVPLLAGALVLSLRPLGLPAEALDAVTGKLMTHGLDRRAVQLGSLILGALGMFLLGWLDDRHELGAGAKFAGQCVVAALVAAAGVRITLFVPSLLFSYAVTILWILTVTNALNFMDNMNGLCAGLGAIAAWHFAMIASGAGQYLVAVFALAACGALLGFLPYNFPRAKAFLGDSGSHLVGYLLAVLAILPHFYTKTHAHRWAVVTPLLVLAVPLLDLAWVVVLRWRLGKPVYVGDTNHLSHRLTQHGWSPTTAVLVIWLVAALAGALAYL
jgi:UDP-GlcNAc:undecaprenyl-phosphate GlcNAc-1-phosphate transferase